MFYKWLNAAKIARHRRQVLQEAEEEMRRRRLAAAWDMWRGRYETEKLLPLVCHALSRHGPAIPHVISAGAYVRCAEQARTHVQGVYDLAFKDAGWSTSPPLYCTPCSPTLQSLPAVRFHASNLKATHWQKWREAMPRALQAKTARELDKKFVVCEWMFERAYLPEALIHSQRTRMPSGCRRCARRGHSALSRKCY
jgi:protein SFI1